MKPRTIETPVLKTQWEHADWRREAYEAARKERQQEREARYAAEDDASARRDFVDRLRQAKVAYKTGRQHEPPNGQRSGAAEAYLLGPGGQRHVVALKNGTYACPCGQPHREGINSDTCSDFMYLTHLTPSDRERLHLYATKPPAATNPSSEPRRKQRRGRMRGRRCATRRPASATHGVRARASSARTLPSTASGSVRPTTAL